MTTGGSFAVWNSGQLTTRLCVVCSSLCVSSASRYANPLLEKRERQTGGNTAVLCHGWDTEGRRYIGGKLLFYKATLLVKRESFI